MIREANKLDCINLTVLSLEVWIQTYCIDGITSENSKYSLSMFTEEYFSNLLKNPTPNKTTIASIFSPTQNNQLATCS